MPIQKLPPELEEVLRFTADFGRTIQFYKLYPETHPFVKEGGANAIQKLEELFKKREKITIGVTEGHLFIEDEQVFTPPISCKEMIGVFGRLSLTSVVLKRGLTEDEFRTFIKEIVAIDKRALNGEKVDTDAELSQFPHIERNVFTYKRVTTKEEQTLDKVKETAAALGRDETDVVNMLLDSSEVDFEKLGSDMLLELMEGDPDKFSSVVIEALKRAETEGKPLTPPEKDPDDFMRNLLDALRSSDMANVGAAIAEIEETPEEFISVFAGGLSVVEEKTGVDPLSLMSRVPERFCSEMSEELGKSDKWKGFVSLLNNEPRKMAEILRECLEKTEKKVTHSMFDAVGTGLGRFAYALVEVLEEEGTPDANKIAQAVKSAPAVFSSSVFDSLKKEQEEKGVSFEQIIEDEESVFKAAFSALTSLNVEPEIALRNRKVISNAIREELGRVRGRVETDTKTKFVVQKVFKRLASVMVNSQDASLGDLEAAFVKIFSKLPPPVVKALFGVGVSTVGEKETSELVSTLSRRLRAKAMMNEFLKDYSEMELPALFRKITRFADEIGDMASVFAEELRGITSEQKREEVLTRLIQGMRKTIPAPSESKQKALLVDNDEEAVGMFKKVLFEEGFKVEVTSDGSEALKSVKERKPDIVVMDIRLTGKLSGMDVMRSLRPLKVPLILATRYVAFKSDFEFESYPKKEFLMKPFDEEQLRKAIRSLIPKKEQPEQTTEVTAFESGELSEAEKIQKSLLPRQLPQIAGFHLSVAYSPCLGVSGDYYDVISLGGNKYGVLLCDVSGKGISAAMVMVLVRTLFRTVAPWHDSPKATLLHLNTLLSKEMSEGMFVSGVYLVIDADTRTVSIANAGHCPPVFWAEERGNVEVQTLKMSGMVMGLVDATLFESKMNEGVFQVQPGVGIVLYSDGVTEAMNEKKQEFGEENLLEVVKKSAVYEPERLIANVYGALQMFRGSAPQSDDTTIVCIKCTG